MNKIEYNGLIAFHPGYYVKDTIEAMEITHSEFAKRLGTTGNTVSRLVNGEIPLSHDLALKLSNMLGTGIEVWLNLQTEFDEQCFLMKQEKVMNPRAVSHN
ncbi:MAG: HigA family addiction module antidote protein [Acidaminococcaceae bacterium]|nr:HigA family addiction module antidote protein [Acidaminococcaceae bacterium]